MRKRNLLLILILVLSASLLIFSCGCSAEDDENIPAAGSGDDISASVDADEPQDGDDEKNGDSDKDSDADEPDENNASNGQDVSEVTGSPADKNTAASSDKNEGSKTSVKDYPADAPWEGFDMYGVPDALDTLTEDDGDLLVLVNKLHAVSKNYYPSDMVAVDGKYTTNQGLEMKSDAYDAYLQMRKAARADEIYFKICSAYRTYSTQEYLYNSYLGSMGEDLRNIRSAYPGRSEHHTGYAIDITSKSMGWTLSQAFADYPEGEWINEHCSEYGFIIRYPKGKTDITGYDYEPWHLRYVGTEVAAEITEQGITLEEYLGR